MSCYARSSAALLLLDNQQLIKLTKTSLWINEGLRVAASSRSQDSELSKLNPNIEALHKDKSAAVVALLGTCAKTKDLFRGIRLHEDILRRGFLEQCADALITMYAKCGALARAKELLDAYKSRDVISWTSLISGYAQQGQGDNALTFFEQMRREGLSPDAVTFTCILKACSSMRAAEKGKQIHEEISSLGLLRKDIVLGNAVVDMYAKCGAPSKARQVLEELPTRDVVSWNALITGYADQGYGDQALACFKQMECEGISPDAVTFSCLLKACGSIGATDKGKQIHNDIVMNGLLKKNMVLGNALVDMYAKCGALAKAEKVLGELSVRNIISWCALITGYVQQGQGEQAIDCYERMKREGISPNAVTFSCILRACASIGAADKGEKIHDEIARAGLLGKDVVLGNALVDMYAKCGALAKAQGVLEKLPARDVVSWNSLISGYAQRGQGEQALDCFDQMQREGLSPNAVTFLCVLQACGSIGAADKGEVIHEELVQQGMLLEDLVLGTALLDMYAKCGALAKAQKVLDELPIRNVISWNALITAYTQQGYNEHAFKCLGRMQFEGLCANEVTYSCILKACGSVEAVGKGEEIHDEIVKQGLLGNNIVLGTTLVEMYARCGVLAKAQHVLEELPVLDVVLWSALLGACQKWGDVNVGRWAFEHAVQVDKSDSAAYYYMSKLYLAAGMQEEAQGIEAMRLLNEH